MIYKVGDIVYIKSLDWYNSNKDAFGSILMSNDFFVNAMAQYCGMKAKILNVKSSNLDQYLLYEIDLDQFWGWTEDMFISISEERRKKLKKLNSL